MHNNNEASSATPGVHGRRIDRACRERIQACDPVARRCAVHFAQPLPIRLRHHAPRSQTYANRYHAPCCAVLQPALGGGVRLHNDTCAFQLIVYPSSHVLRWSYRPSRSPGRRGLPRSLRQFRATRSRPATRTIATRLDTFDLGRVDDPCIGDPATLADAA